MADLADAIAEKLHLKKDESEQQSSSSSDEDDKVMATLSTLLEDDAFECVAGAECQLADAKCKPKGKNQQVDDAQCHLLTYMQLLKFKNDMQ